MMNIYQKLLEARKAMSFEKTAAKDLKYDIFDGDTILEMVGNALAAQNILFVPSMTHADITHEEREKTYNNQTSIQYIQHALAEIHVRFIDADSGEVLELVTHGSAMDYADKALGKAQTYAIKYLFVRMFLKGKSDVNDEERIGDDEPKPAEIPPQTRQKARSASKPAASSSSKPSASNGAQNGKPPDDPVYILAAETFPFDIAWKDKTWEALMKAKPNWNMTFWTAVKELNVTNEELHKAVNVNTINDYKGTPKQLWLEVCKLAKAS